MKVAFHEVGIVSELYDAGRQDDGTPFIGEAYFLQVTLANGERLNHRVHFPGVERCTDEEGWVRFGDIRAQQLRRALRLRRAIRRAGQIGEEMWEPGRPVYGSKAYMQHGRFDDLELERLERKEER